MLLLDLIISSLINFRYLVQMTVVEAYICGKKIDPPNNKSELPSIVVSLLIEAVAQNTTGSVFLPEVYTY